MNQQLLSNQRLEMDGVRKPLGNVQAKNSYKCKQLKAEVKNRVVYEKDPYKKSLKQICEY